jgi:hypothetical protein
MYMSRALGKLYKVHRAATVKGILLRYEGGEPTAAACANYSGKTSVVLPVVKVGEADPVGELQNGDELRHAWELRLARRAIGLQNSFAYCWFGGGIPSFSSKLS